MILDREIDRWVEEGLISAEQAEAIRARYAETETSERRARVVKALAVVGAVVVGVGVILFFAANWDAIPRAARLVLLVAAVVAAYGGGFYLREVRRSYPDVGHTLILLGGILFGASLFLVGQMYHVQAHDPLAFLLWAVAALATAAVVRSAPLAALGLLAFAGWMVHELLFVGAVDYGIELYVPVLAALYGAALYGVGTGARRWLEPLAFAGAMRGLGYALGVLGAFVFTFREVFGEFEVRVLDQPAVVLVLLFGFAAAAAVGAALLALEQSRPTRIWEALAVAAVPALVLLALFLPESRGADDDALVYPILFNVLVAVLALGAVVVGYRSDEVWLVNAGVVFVALDVIARYFDFFWEMLDRSIAFIGAGVLILALALLLERQRSRLVERMQE